MEKDQLSFFNSVRTDPWIFATECVYTKDEADLKKPIKKFPSEFEFLKLYFKVWQRERLMGVPKSRRMFLSWGTLVLYLHDTMFNIGRQTAVVSKKEEDADDLLERMVFILENIPKDKIPPELIPKYKKTYCCLEFPEIGSRVLAFASGADQLRSYAASGILGDESAFWPDAERMYSATFPVIELTGRMTMISSAAPGFFKKLVHDELNEKIHGMEPSPKKFPMTGVEIWKNPGNKFCIFQIHYTANPAKRDPAYKENAKSGMPLSTFMQEYEISWETFAGKPVYRDWNKAIHGSRSPIDPHIGSPILIGVDHGLTPSAVLAQMHGQRLVIFDELVTENMGAERFAELLKRHISSKYPAWSDTKKTTHMWVDPAGFQRSQSDETTCAQKMAKYFNPMPGSFTWEERRTAVEKFLCGMSGGVADIVVDLTKCRVLASGFDGGYHYKESHFENSPEKVMPVKNEFSHCFIAGTKVSTPNGKRNIEDLMVGDFVLSPGGSFKVSATMSKVSNKIVEVHTASGRKITCTSDHPIWSENSFVRADELQYGSSLCLEKPFTKYNPLMELSSILSQMDITKWTTSLAAPICTAMFGNSLTEKLKTSITSIMLMATNQITKLKTYKKYVLENIRDTMELKGLKIIQTNCLMSSQEAGMAQLSGMDLLMEENGTANMRKELPSLCRPKSTSASSVEKIISLREGSASVDFAEELVRRGQGGRLELTMSKGAASYAKNIIGHTKELNKDSVLEIVFVKREERVYDLTVEDSHCFYANDILVSNCHDATQYLCSGILMSRSQRRFNIPEPSYANRG